MTPATRRIVETALYAADVDRAAAWYNSVFGFPVIFAQEDRLRVLHVGDDQVLLLFKEKGTLHPIEIPGGIIPPHDGSGPMHIAFAMRTEEAELWKQRLASHGIAVESQVRWGDNDISLYFRDPDGHAVELITGDYWQKLANASQQTR
jgi:catechol 2,3-dioxygenase-like lactoylglutathione lyase family enzyme